MPPKLVKTPLNATAKAAETAADVLDATAGVLRQAAGPNAEQMLQRVGEQVEEQVQELRASGDESRPDTTPHRGETPAPGTRTRANVGNPKAAKKLRQRSKAQ